MTKIHFFFSFTIITLWDDNDVMEMSNDLIQGQRDYWKSVIDCDMRNINKPKNHLMLDEFEQKMAAAAYKLYA